MLNLGTKASTKRAGRRIGGLLALGLVVLLAAGCDSEDESSKADEEQEAKANKKKEKRKQKKAEEKKLLETAEAQCDTLGKACGKKEKHAEAIAKGCKEPLKEQLKAGCTTQLVAVFACYEKDICSGKEAVQVYDDFRVLTKRHDKCGDEMSAAQACMKGSAGAEKN